MLHETQNSSSPPTWSRRQFLKTTSSATAVLAAPYFVSASALSGKGRVGANDRIGIAYIGCGRRSAQLRNLPLEGQVVAAADCHLGRAREVAAKYNGQSFRDYRQLLDSKDVDAVIIATPDHWHALPSIHACQAGKDVYVEKPMTLTIAEGRLMVRAARKYKRVVQTGSQQRSMKTNVNACRLIREGAIGKIHTVVGHNYPSPWSCNLPGQQVPADLDWEMWCGQTNLQAFHQDIYVLMDEGVVSPVELREFIKLKMIDGVALKPSRCGGLVSAKQQIELILNEGLIWLGSGLTDPDISLAATLGLYGAFELKRPAALNGPQFLTADVLKTPLDIRDGKAVVPSGPGLGIKVDENKLLELTKRTK